MLVNQNDNVKSNVEFISYTGRYPCLCSGVLTMKITGKVYTFGNHRSDSPLFPKFWHSGGNCGFTNNYSDSYVNEGEWIIDVSALPEELISYAAEIDQVFNENAPHGCCGGCL